MIFATVFAPSVIEPGSTVELTARAFATDAPFSALSLEWAQTGGLAGTLEPLAGSARFTAPEDAAPGDIFTIALTVAQKSEVTSVFYRIETVPLIGQNLIRLASQIEPGTLLLPRGDWFYDVDFTALEGGAATLRSLNPARLFTRLSFGDSLAMVPTVVQRRFLNRWRVFVPAAAAGETVLELVSELAKVERDGIGPYLTLRRPAEQIHRVIWKLDASQDELVPAPWITHQAGSTLLRLDSALLTRLDAGEDGLFQVRYYAKDTAEDAGWYRELGLGPNDQTEATLLTVYGAGPFVDPTLGVSGDAWTVTREASHSVPVRLAGRQALKPYYHIWKRDGSAALLREPYEGVIGE